MAYATKYLFKFQSANGTTREIRVLKDGYSGSVLQRALGRAPILKKQKNGTVFGTSLEFYAECKVDGEFAEFYTTDPKAYKVQLYAGNDKLWEGFVTPELYAEPDIAPPYDVQVIATDGVGELKLYDFAAQGSKTLRQMFTYLLGYTGVGTDVYLISSMKAGSSGAGALLEKTINLDYMAGKNCYEVLTYLLDTLHATISWWKGAWIVARETNVTFQNGKVKYFNTAGNAAQLAGSVVTLGKMYSNDAWPVGQLTQKVDPAKKSVTVQAPWHPVTCLVNSDMDSDTGWTKTNNAAYNSSKKAYSLPDNAPSANVATIAQNVAMGGIRVPMSFSGKFCATAAPTTGAIYGGIAGIGIKYVTSGSVSYYLAQDSEGNPQWVQGTLTGNTDFQIRLSSVDTDEINAETLEFEIPALAVGSSFPAGTLTFEIVGRAALVFNAYLDVTLPKGYQDRLHLDNGARGEGDTVEIAIGRETSDIDYYKAFLQGILLDSGSLITSFKDDALTTATDFLSYISRDYARSFALPRIIRAGKVGLESAVTFPPLVFTKGAIDYWVETWGWDMYEDELDISARSLPTATITVESEVISEATGTTSSSQSSGGSSSSIQPGGANYFELSGSDVQLKSAYEKLILPVLQVTGNATIGGTLGVTGAATLSSTLAVTGLATLSGGIALGGTYNSQDSKLVWDATNNAWHLIGNFYADGWISAGGISSGGGSAGIDLQAMWNSLQNNDNADTSSTAKFHKDHFPTPGNGVTLTYDSNGLVTGISATGTTYTAGTGIDITSNVISINSTCQGYFDTISDCLQSLQSQIDSVATKNGFDELYATTLWADQISASNAYFGAIELNGSDLATINTGLGNRISALEGYFDASGNAKKALQLTNTRTLWGQSFDGTANVSGSLADVTTITASGLVKTTNYVQATRFYLSDSIYFVVDSFGVKLVGAGFYTDSFISAGGMSSGGGASGIDWGALAAATNEQINITHLTDALAGYATTASLSNYLTTSAAASTYLTIATAASTYLTTTAASSTYQPIISDLSTIRSRADEGHTIYGYFSNGVLDSSHLPSMYIGTTAVQFSSATQNLTGIGSITATGALTLSTTKRIYFGDTSHYLELDSNGFHFSHGVYSDSFMSAGGISSGGGSAGIDLQAMWNSLQNNDNADTSSTAKFHKDHFPTPGNGVTLTYDSNGLVTGISATGTTYTAGTGIDITSNVISINSTCQGYFDTISDCLQSLQSQIDSVATKNGFDELYATTLWADQISASNAYFGAIELNGSDLATINTGLGNRISALEGYFDASGNAKKALQLTNTRTLWGQSFDGTANVSGSLADVTTITASGLVKTTNYVQATRFYLSDSIYFVVDSFGVKLVGAGFYTDSFISAGGMSSGGGASGIDWGALAAATNEQINITHLTDALAGYATTASLSNYLTTSAAASTYLTIATAASTYLTTTAASSTYQPIISDLSTIRSRADEGHTAYGWGNHADAGYLLSSTAASTYQPIISDLSTIRTNASNGATAYSWGNHALAGYLTSSNGTTISQCLQSLQSQVDSVASRNAFDEFRATVLFADQITATTAYIESVTGNLTGTAARATGDADGNTIKSTYGASLTAASNALSLVSKAAGTLSTITAANLVTVLGNNAVNRAAADGDGNTISSTYLKLSGGTMTGAFSLLANQYNGLSGYGLNANNSDIVGLNSIYTEDLADDMGEGIHFYRSSGYWDSLTSSNGVLYYYPNRPTATTAFANAYTILHSGNYSSYALPLSGGQLEANSYNILNINSTHSSGNNYAYFKVSGTDKASVGYYSGLAFVANEATYARIGVNDAGTPQYWSSASSSTAQTLYHSGNSNKSDVSWTCYNLTAYGAVTAGSASDARLKTNIASISDEQAKRIVMALRPVNFTWNEKATALFDQYKGDDTGFIAQEVEPLLPMAVGTIFNDYKRLDATKIIPCIVKVEQDHETRIQRLERENRELKAEIQRLKTN